MKKIALHLVLILFIVAPPAVSTALEATEPELLPDLVLKVPEDPRHKEYLGLNGASGSDFSIKDIDADILLIELFNMYCPYCQKAAPTVNELYAKMRDISMNGPVVKIIGLGVSNSSFEVEHFRDTYEVSFPLFADKDMTLYKALSGEGTPVFIGCRLNKGQRPVIFMRKFGVFYSSGQFLQELIYKGGLNQ